MHREIPSRFQFSEIEHELITVQFQAVPGEKKINTERLFDLLSDFKPTQNSFLILPELTLSGYNLQNPEDYYKLSETPNGQSFSYFKSFCKKYRCNVIYGFIEAHHKSMYNSQCLITADGDVASIYRKKNLYMSNNLIADRLFCPGSGYSVIKYAGKKIGFGLCMDINIDSFIRFFEMMSPDLLFISCCWLEENINLNIYWCYRLKNIRGTIVLSNAWGKQANCEFAGKSCMIKNGKILSALPSTGDSCLVK